MNLKVILGKYMIHLEFVPTLSVFQKGLKAIKKTSASHTENYQGQTPCSLMIYLANLLFFIAVNMQIIISSKRFFKGSITGKRSRKSFF